MQVARSGACAAELGGRLYVCGGLGREGALRSVEIFDPDTGRWEQGPTLRGPRFSAACCVLGERLYVMGGCADAARGVACAAVEVLECDGPFWEEAPPLCPPRMGACAIALDARIYLMGGLGH